MNTRSNVAIRTGNGRHAFGSAGVLQELGETEISNMSFEVGIKKNVIRFNITVEDQRRAVMVEIAKALGSLNCDLIPSVPMQMTTFLAMKDLPKTSIGHVLINQEIGLMVGAEAKKPNNVSVTNPSKCLNLGGEAIVV